MVSQTYVATGVLLRALEKTLGIRLRVSGGENLEDRPTLFVVNHFTRFETMIIPYVVYRYSPKQLRSLADHALFKGVLGRYLTSCGVMSVHEPLRNRTIIHDLMTGLYDWVIYPEGVMLKNKKVVQNGRLTLNCPDRHRAPHTGAAVLALKTELTKRRIRSAQAAGRESQCLVDLERYGIDSPQDICPDDTMIVPVNITYYPLRPDKNVLNRLAKMIRPDLPARVDEELQVEGKILLGDSQMSIHFAKPITVADYLDRPTQILRRIARLISKPLETDLLLGRQARRLTGDAMAAIYHSVEINFDHLFCYGLCAHPSDTIPIGKMRRALYLSAIQLRQHDDLRLHPHLRAGMTPLVTGGPFEPLDSIIKLAQDDGVLSVEEGVYRIHHAALMDPHDFHAIRLNNAVQVIANELEPVRVATSTIRANINLDEPTLRKRVSQHVAQIDRHAFVRDYDLSCTPGPCKPAHIGEPFFLEAPDLRVGVVLAHGYLSAPEEIRPMAQYLHERGLSVYGVRLMGHGTTPQALTSVTWQDWMRSMARGYAAIRHRCERVVVGGFSLGGVLSLCLAATGHHEIDAVFSINAPMKLRDRRTVMIPAVLWWNRLLRSVRLGDGADASVPNDDTESPGINYEVNYLRGARQLQLAMSACRKQLRRVTAPALVVQADADPLVHPQSAKLIYESLGSPSKWIAEMDFDRHVIVRGDRCEQVFEAVFSFVNRVEHTNPSERTLVRR